MAVCFQNTFSPIDKVSGFGGAIENIDSNSEVFSSDFLNNQIEGKASIVNNALIPSGGRGAIYNKNGDHYYSECIFERNVTSGKGGGAIYSDGANVIIQNSFFRKNRAIGLDINRDFLRGVGGAIFGINGNTIIENSIIEDNFSSGVGGGVWLGVTDEGVFNQNRIERSKIINNSSDLSGGGGYLEGQSTVLASHVSK